VSGLDVSRFKKEIFEFIDDKLAEFRLQKKRPDLTKETQRHTANIYFQAKTTRVKKANCALPAPENQRFLRSPKPSSQRVRLRSVGLIRT
jgi:hypothetical protein